MTNSAYADDLESALASLRGVVDGLEVVDELSHALQCAQLAMGANASRELVAAALLHDIARSPIVAREFPGVTHERAGAAWLEPRLGPSVAWLVGAHVAAKLYLLEHDPSYAAHLSQESRRSAAAQRAPELEELALERAWPDALLLRRWDDEAKVPGTDVPDPLEILAFIKPLVRSVG